MNPQVKRRKNASATDVRNLRTLLLLSVFAPEDIAARLRQVRAEAGLTQEEFADLVGVSTRSWQGYEAGDSIPYRHMARIAEVSKRKVAWLIHGDTEDAEGTIDRLERIEGQLDEIRGMLGGRKGGETRQRRASSR